MNKMRQELKEKLLKRDPTCAIGGGRAQDLHEIVCPPLDGGKYTPNDTPLARIVYSEENCVLLCNKCNVMEANNLRDRLIRHNMDIYGIDHIVTVYRNMASWLKSPRSWIPESVLYGDEWVKIL